MTDQFVTLAVEDRLGRLRFDRPEHDNRITYGMMNEFAARLGEAHEADVDLLLVEGAGEHFCTGRDQREDLSEVPWSDVIDGIMDANELLASFEGISIAAVTGRATGFGCGIAVQCDLTLATETATFGFDEIKHGIAPKIVLSYLETYVNRKTALDLILTGRNVAAREATRMGLATRTFPEDGFDTHVEGVVDLLAEYDPAALSEIKFFLREIETVDPEDRRDVVLDRMT